MRFFSAKTLSNSPPFAWRGFLAIGVLGVMLVSIAPAQEKVPGEAPPKSDASGKKAVTPIWEDVLPKSKLDTYWTTAGNWNLSEGVVTLKPRAGESGWQRYDSYLWLNGEYADFEIEFEYNVEKKSNSGFYFHVGDVKNPVATGVEVQIYDSFGKPDSAKLTDHDSGGIIPGVPPTKNTAKAPGEWNRFLISVKGNQLKVALNGETVNEVDLSQGKLKDRPAKGAIGFQDHALPLSLRNIRIRQQ